MNEPATFQLPEQMSTVAGDIDWLYYFIYWLSVVLFVAIIGAMLYWAIKYRERKGHKAEPTGHNMPLEIAWTIAPLFILAFLFHKGFVGYMDMAVAPAGSMEIRVNAKQWGWEFVYPNGGSDSELHVPVHKPVKLVMGSADVLHSFFVPALRVKRDVVPGMFTSVWFEATHTGQDDIMCAEYCGGRSKDVNGNELPFAQMTGHWSMHSLIHVETEAGLHEIPPRHRRQMRGLHGEGAALPDQRARRGGRGPLLEEGVSRVPHDDRHEAHWPVVEGHLGQGRVDRPRRGQGRRVVRSRVDPRSAGEDRRRLPADDALVPRPDQRRRDRRAHRVHQEFEGMTPSKSKKGKESTPWQQSTSR